MMKRFSHYSNNSLKPRDFEGYFSGQGQFIQVCEVKPTITAPHVRAAFVQIVYSCPTLLTAYCHAQDGASYIQHFSPEETARLIEQNFEQLENADEMRRILPPEERALPLRVFFINQRLYLAFSHEIFNGFKSSRIRSLFLAMLGCEMTIAEAQALISNRMSKLRLTHGDRLSHTFRSIIHILGLGLCRWNRTQRFVCPEPLLLIKDLAYRSTFHKVDALRFYSMAKSESLSPSDYFMRSLASTFFDLTNVQRFTFIVVTDLHKIDSSLTVDTPGNFSGGVPFSLLRKDVGRFRLNHKVLLAVTSFYYGLIKLLSKIPNKSRKPLPEQKTLPPQDVRKTPFPLVSGFGDFLPLISFLDASSSADSQQVIVQNTGPFPVLIIKMTQNNVGVAVGMNSTRFGEEEQFLNLLIGKCLEKFGTPSKEVCDFSSHRP